MGLLRAFIVFWLGRWGILAYASSDVLDNADLEVSRDPSEACLAALSANVSCPAITKELSTNPYFDFNRNITLLESVCATSCRESLQEHSDNVRVTFAGIQYYDEFEQTPWQPWYLVEQMVYSHDIACMARSDGQLCNAYFWEHGPPESDCDECVLKIAHRHANFPFVGDESAREQFASMMDSCQATGYLVTTSWLKSTPTLTGPSCTSAKYTIQLTDADYSTFMPWFYLDAGEDAKIPLAERTRADCWDYIWFSGTGPARLCWDYAWAAGVEPDQFALWNPSIDQNTEDDKEPTYDYPCTLSPSVSYCLRLTSPTPAPSPTRSVPAPRASGEISDCIWWVYAVDGVSCADLLRNLHLPIDVFYKMNPSVKEDCTGMEFGIYYCGSTLTMGMLADEDDDELYSTQTPRPTSPTSISMARDL